MVCDESFLVQGLVFALLTTNSPLGLDTTGSERRHKEERHIALSVCHCKFLHWEVDDACCNADRTENVALCLWKLWWNVPKLVLKRFILVKNQGH